MAVIPIPTVKVVNEKGLVTRPWYDWLRQISVGVPVALPSFTVATVPTASKYTGTLIYVSNESGGPVPAFSDGTNWRRVNDRAIIS